MVFEATAAGADTIIRPTALGVSTYTQIRDAGAPEAYSWQLSLPGGLVPQLLDDGSVAIAAAPEPMTDDAVTEDSSFGSAAVATADTVAGSETATVSPPVQSDTAARHAADTQTAHERRVPDARAKTESAARTLAYAGVQTDGHIVAAIQKPWAVDANGTQVPVSLSVRGDIVTMTVEHRDGAFAMPIIADPDLIDCARTTLAGRTTRTARPRMRGNGGHRATGTTRTSRPTARTS